MAISVETLVKQLTDSSIIAPGKLEGLIPPKAQPKNADELLAELVKQNHLTKFQAAQIAAGKAKALILGNYTILDKIGAGGMGQVFRAEHRRMERVVAIKMLPPAMTRDVAALARFQREVKAAAKLSHANIVAAYDADEANGAHFLVMEYVEGKDLSATVKKEGPLPLAKALNYTLQAARGLEFAHKKGVVHRDIKPANLLLDNEGTVKILDMGLARIDAGGNVAAQAELTGTGAIMGTVDYMAPEQGMSTKNADARADIYSLGCSLYYLLAGKAAYDGETVAAKLVAHHTHAIPNLRDVQPDASEQLEAVFKKMVAKRLDDRYQTMTEVIADLERCQAALSAAAAGNTGTQGSSGTIDQSELSIAMANTPLRSIYNRDDATQQFPDVSTPKTVAGAAPVITHKGEPRGSSPRSSGKKSSNSLVMIIGGSVVSFVLIALGVWVVIRDKSGNEVAKLKVPTGGKVEVKTEPDAAPTFGPPGGAPSTVGNQTGGPAPITTYKQPAFKNWMVSVIGLSTEKQIEAVNQKLAELNPGYQGKLAGLSLRNSTFTGSPKVEDGIVTEIGLSPYKLLDISPLRVFSGLKVLACDNLVGGPTRAEFADLSPLQGMSLKRLSLMGTSVTDLSPLRGMPLEMLMFQVTSVSDLSPLKGMPLTNLNCSTTRVKDLSPVRDARLDTLYIYGSQVSDLSPIKGMPLKTLLCQGQPIADLSVLAGMPLETVVLGKIKTTDLSPLLSCKNLKRLEITRDQYPADQIAALQKALPKCKIEWYGATSSSANEPAVAATVAGATNPPAGAGGSSAFALDFSPLRQSSITIPNWIYDGATPLTVEAWVMPRSMPTPDQGASVTVLANRSTGGFVLGLSTTSHQWVFTVEGKNGVKIIQSRKAEVGKPVHLAGVFSNGQIRLYVDGIKAAEDRIELPYKSSGRPVILGASTWKTFDGTIDEVRISSVARYTADFSPQQRFAPDDQTEALYHFDEGAGTVAKDSSLHQRDGTIIGATWVPLAGGSGARASSITTRSEAGATGDSRSPGLRPGAKPWQTPEFEAWVKATQALPADKQLEAVSRKLMELNPGFDGKLTSPDSRGTPKIENGVVTELAFVAFDVTDVSPVRALLGLKQLGCLGSKLRQGQLSDLTPLQGMQLSKLGFEYTLVSDLSPLRGMKLTQLSFTPKNITKGIDAIRQMQSLTTIGIGWETQDKFTPAEFWKKYDAGEFGKPAAPVRRLAYLDPAFQKWIDETQKLPADKQLEAVSRKLMELNPGFDGKLTGTEGKGTPKIENNVVVELGLFTENVTDLSSLRALAGLNSLWCYGGDKARGRLSDLSPLRGMPLVYLSILNAPVSDLSPLEGMALKRLYVLETQVNDLSPLRGMKLTNLVFNDSLVTDLSPLESMPLIYLSCEGTPVSDLKPLQTCKALGALLAKRSQVTAAQVAALQKVLPNCKVEWDGAGKTP